MGAWGLGLFQSDHDLEIVEDLDCQAGLLPDEILMRSVQALGKKVGLTDKGIKPGQIGIHNKFSASLYAKNCTNVKHTRGLFVEDAEQAKDGNTSSALTHRLNDLIKSCVDGVREQAKLGNLRNPHGSAYRTVILGACLMSLGCNLPESFIKLLNEIYFAVGLMRDAEKQMQKALGPKGFTSGTPYEFGSLSKEELVNFPSKWPAYKDRLHPNSRMFNVPAPNDSATDEQVARLPKGKRDMLIHEKAMIKALANEKYQVCNTCGVGKSEDGSLLKQCSKCAIVKYCSISCQRADLNDCHKDICSTLAQYPKGKKACVFVGCRSRDPDWKEKAIFKPMEDNIKKSARPLPDGLKNIPSEFLEKKKPRKKDK